MCHTFIKAGADSDGLSLIISCVIRNISHKYIQIRLSYPLICLKYNQIFKRELKKKWYLSAIFV